MKQSIRFSIKTSIPDITNSTLGGDVLEAKQQELFFSELRGIRDKVSQLSIFANGNNDSSNEKLISLYELHTIFPNSGTAIAKESTDELKIAKEKRLISIIESCYFESGIWTEADEYFESLVKSSSSIESPLALLSSIVNHNLSDDHILEGVLHILSNYSYDEIEPFGISVAIACAVNHSLIIQDLLSSCFEKWNAVDAIDILTGLQLEEPWLSEYRDDVVSQLKRKDTGA